MMVSRLIYCTVIAVTGFGTVASGSDSTETPAPDSARLPAAVAIADSTAVPDTLAAFSVLNRKYIKTTIITNVLYAAGFGLLYGAVMPRSRKLESDDAMGSLKLLPLNLLAVGMMYASVPISVVSSHRAKKNYAYYYKTPPRNISLPLTFASAGQHVVAAGISYWLIIKDYRDNNEIDGSYNTNVNPTMGLLTSGLITFGCTNLYSLVYTVILGKKAEENSAATTASLHLAPFRYGDANGCMLTWDF